MNCCKSSTVKKDPLLVQIVASNYEDWVIEKEIGFGSTSNSVVYLVHNEKIDPPPAVPPTETPVKAAMKTAELRRAALDDKKRYDEEWQHVVQMRHPHLVSMYAQWIDREKKKTHTLMEYVKGPGLLFFLRQDMPTLPSTCIGRIFVQLLSALSYMHAKKMCHRDLKPEKILLTSENPETADAKIADFGFARTLSTEQGVASMSQTVVGTVTYMAPERLRNGAYTFSADIWSLGLILVQLITKRHLFHECRDHVQELKDAQRYADSWLADELPPEFKKITGLASGLLAFSAEERWSIETIAKDPWVREHIQSNRVTIFIP